MLIYILIIFANLPIEVPTTLGQNVCSKLPSLKVSKASPRCGKTTTSRLGMVTAPPNLTSFN